MDNRIYIKEWLELKPYEKQTVTDSYYLKLSNSVKNAIKTSKHWFVLQMYLDEKNISMLACFLTSYFEDIISETRLWSTFINTHQQLYKKQLPFYKLEEYYNYEINTQDISLLIWYFLNTVQEEKFIAPFNDFIVETSEKVMGIFDEAWEFAPENEYLKSFYQIDEAETDFYIARKLIDTILFKSYLYYPDSLLKLRKQELEIFDEDSDEDDTLTLLNEYRDSTLHKIHTRLLSLQGKEWTAKILGNKHPLSSDYLNISKKIRGYFLYKGQDESNIFIEHIASGKKFKLTKKSIDNSSSFKEIDSIIYIGIVLWKKEWWFSGVFFQQSFDADLILDEKNSIQSRMDVNFLDHQEKETDELLELQFKAFKDFNNGSQIAFLSSEKIEDFYKGYMEFFNNSLNLSEKEVKEAKQRVRKEGLFDINDKSIDFNEVSASGLVFFNPKSGCEIALDVNSAFPLPTNPYYKKETSEDHIMQILMNENLSTELVMYCIDNCKSDLSFFNTSLRKLIF